MKFISLKIVRVVGVCLSAVGFAGAMAAFFISSWQVQNAPGAPNFSSGEVNAFFTRGVYIYLNDFDYMVEAYLFNASVIVVCLGVGARLWAGDREK